MIKSNSRYLIKTQDGYKDFDGVRRTENTGLIIKTLYTEVRCTKEHRILVGKSNSGKIYRKAQKLCIGNKIKKDTITNIEIDETIIFKFMKQGERWVNRKLKEFCKKIYFEIHFLEMTYMSRDSYIKNLKEASMAGVPCKMRYASAIGLSPSAIVHNEFLENSVLEIVDNWLPLQSAYQTNSNDNGRPQNDDDNLTDGGEDARNRGTNDPDNRG